MTKHKKKKYDERLDDLRLIINDHEHRFLSLNNTNEKLDNLLYACILEACNYYNTGETHYSPRTLRRGEFIKLLKKMHDFYKEINIEDE